MSIRITRSNERGQIALVSLGEAREEREGEGDGGADGVGREVWGPEGGEEIGGVPAGGDGVLH